MLRELTLWGFWGCVDSETLFAKLFGLSRFACNDGMGGLHIGGKGGNLCLLFLFVRCKGYAYHPLTPSSVGGGRRFFGLTRLLCRLVRPCGLWFCVGLKPNLRGYITEGINPVGVLGLC